jgi:hypothetical protein
MHQPHRALQRGATSAWLQGRDPHRHEQSDTDGDSGGMQPCSSVHTASTHEPCMCHCTPQEGKRPTTGLSSLGRGAPSSRERRRCRHPAESTHTVAPSAIHTWPRRTEVPHAAPQQRGETSSSAGCTAGQRCSCRTHKGQALDTAATHCHLLHSWR